MPIAGTSNMGTPFFHELKKQASFFLKEKIRTARLALTDVTPAELLTEEATDGNPWAPDARTMGFISRAAFEIDDYWRIVEILHKRLEKFDRKHWREPYKALLLLEHLLTHGPESVSDEFQIDREVVQEMETFQYIDERGFNWGLTVRKKSERILKLLEKGPLLKEERDRARKITRGIQGFGSLNQRWTSTEMRDAEEAPGSYGRSNSHYENFYSKQEEDAVDAQIKKKNETGEKPTRGDMSDKNTREVEEEARIVGANAVLMKSFPPEESKPLLANQNDEPKIELQEVEHPFKNQEHQMKESMLLLSQT